MKTMNRMVPSARKARKQQDRARRTDEFVDTIIEEMKQLPPTERQEIVDLFALLCVSEKHG